MVEEACRLNVKWSLQELSKAINGDGKTAPNSLFKVCYVIMEYSLSTLYFLLLNILILFIQNACTILKYLLSLFIDNNILFIICQIA